MGQLQKGSIERRATSFRGDAAPTFRKTLAGSFDYHRSARQIVEAAKRTTKLGDTVSSLFHLLHCIMIAP